MKKLSVMIVAFIDGRNVRLKSSCPLSINSRLFPGKSADFEI
jgi:hypothetical protein